MLSKNRFENPRRKVSGHLRGIAFLVMLVVSACQTATPAPTPLPPVDFATVRTAVEKGVKGASVKEFVLCHLQKTLWSEKDGSAQVSAIASADGKAHVYKITSGQFSDEAPLTNSNGSSPASTDGGGVVQIKDQETAFKKGLPFFITDVVVTGPKQIKYTVVTNPNASIKSVMPVEESHTSSMQTMVFRNDSIEANTQPQTKTYSWTSSSSNVSDYLFLATKISGTNNVCLQSNEIDLLQLGASATEVATEAATP